MEIVTLTVTDYSKVQAICLSAPYVTLTAKLQHLRTQCDVIRQIEDNSKYKQYSKNLINISLLSTSNKNTKMKLDIISSSLKLEPIWNLIWFWNFMFIPIPIINFKLLIVINILLC